jgi:hypothetical protein
MSGSPFIPCQWCKKEFYRKWSWYICDSCGFRICVPCISEHQGQYGAGLNCSQCSLGQMRGPGPMEP